MSIFMESLLTAYALNEHGVEYDAMTEKLVPYSSLSIEELDIVASHFEGLGSPWLDIRLGDGVTYELIKSMKYGTNVQAIVKSRNDCFAYPIEVKVVVSHEAQAREDHQDECPYASDEWPVDASGRDVWIYPSGQVNYDPECWCEYVTDSVQEFTVADDEGWASVKAYMEEVWAKV